MVPAAIRKLLADPSPEAAAALLKDLPNLIPDDPALAAVIADEMAKEFGTAADVVQNSDADSDTWEIVSIEERGAVSNKWNPEDHPRGGDEHFPQRFSADGSAENRPKMTNPEKGKRIVDIAKDENAEPVMLGRPEGLETNLRVDPLAAAHIIGRRNQQRSKRIEQAKATGDKEALAKAEAMLTGEQIAEMLPDEVEKGKVVGRHYDVKQRREMVDIDTPLLHVGARKQSPSRKHRQGDKEFGVSTAFPPDDEFAKKTKRGDR